jgi:DNA repair exonuclease SbcCD nuclease subunit
MKVALVTDTHFGARSDSLAFDAYFKKFYDEYFFPYLQEHNIDTIVHLGDAFDRRKFINYNTLKSCKEYFFGQAERLGMTLHMIPGNHDTYYKNTNDVNSLELLLKEYDNIHVYPEVTEITLDERKILFVPWICNDNYSTTMDAVKSTDAKVCFGHFEFSGFQMYKGIPNPHGMDTDAFDHFDLVCSGHFHHRSSRDNITYLGNPYEITWSDYDDDRGFHLYDTDTNELDFIKNPYKMFHKLFYNDMDGDSSFDLSGLVGSCVKLIVVKKENFLKFDKLVDSLYTCNCVELKIVEDFSEFEDDAVGDDAELAVDDTMTLLRDYIGNTVTDLDKNKLTSVVQTLYVEAQHME